MVERFSESCTLPLPAIHLLRLQVPVVGTVVSAACAINTTRMQSAMATGSLNLNFMGFMNRLLNYACPAELNYLFERQAFEALVTKVAQRFGGESTLLCFHRLMRVHFCISGFLERIEEAGGNAIIMQIDELFDAERAESQGVDALDVVEIQSVLGQVDHTLHIETGNARGDCLASIFRRDAAIVQIDQIFG